MILPPQARTILDSVPAVLKKTFPIPARFRGSLPSQIAKLSRLLTSGRGDRSLSYLSRPDFLSAYLNYFLPWNLCRLCLLLPDLELNLRAGDKIADIGSGPLTLVSALWISRPDLRELPLEFACIDRCAPALEAGKKFFTAISGGSKWKINLVKEDIDIRKRTGVMRKGKLAALVCAVNMFNEIYDSLPHSNIEALRKMAANSARLLHNYASPSAVILTVEPGVPQSGRFITFLRSAFMELGRLPKSPCPHTAVCPASSDGSSADGSSADRSSGAKKRWCHFAFETESFPKELNRLSAAAGIPKERLVFSFLLTGPVMENAAKTDSSQARVISDAFPLPNNCFGRYGCSAQGLILLTGEKSRIQKIVSGSLVTPVFAANEKRDAKSGALIAEVL